MFLFYSQSIYMYVWGPTKYRVHIIGGLDRGRSCTATKYATNLRRSSFSILSRALYYVLRLYRPRQFYSILLVLIILVGNCPALNYSAFKRCGSLSSHLLGLLVIACSPSPHSLVSHTFPKLLCCWNSLLCILDEYLDI